MSTTKKLSNITTKQITDKGVQQCAFTLAIACNESYSLGTFDRKRYIFKKNESTETFAQSLNLQVNSHKNLFIAREDTKKRVAPATSSF